MSLFETLARKHGRLVDGLAGAVDEKEEEGFTEVSEAVQDAAVLEEVDYPFSKGSILLSLCIFRSYGWCWR